jgi:hypothetical protein
VIDCLVFSCDRAFQLDGLLRSIAAHDVSYATVTVLAHNWSDGIHRDSLETVRGEHPDVEFVACDGPAAFEANVRRFLDGGGRVVFHTDDDVFFRAPEPGLLDRPEVVSLRLGRNTTWCQTNGVEQSPPESMRWRWRGGEEDFGYPLSINATVYDAGDVERLLDFPFGNPSELESGLADRRHWFAPEWMVAGEHSCCVSLPLNSVSPWSRCPRGADPDYQPDALCARYLSGWRMDFAAMDFGAVVGAHQEIPLQFGKERSAWAA